MNKIFFTLISMAALMAALNGYASGLVPEQCTIGDRLVSYPIVDVSFTFDDAVGVIDNATAAVYSDNQAVATGALSAANYVSSKRTQGAAIITFDPPLILPKGKTYNLVVPEEAIFLKEQPTVTNDMLTAEFHVPDNLGDAKPSVEEGSTVTNARSIGFYFGIETAPVENGEAILYREDVPVKKYPCDVSWDWNLGYAGIDFGERINFEAGVKYTVVLPPGSVSSLYRSDITNEEASVSFIGGYTKSVAPIQYVWCSLYDNHPGDVLGEVKFYYNQPVVLCVNPIVQLCFEADGTVVNEAVPTISEADDRYVMTADFENTPLIPGKGYTIIIPEGTLVTENGDVIVNARNTMSIGGSSGISEIKDTDYNVTVANGVVSIANTSFGDEIVLLSLDGKVVYNAKSDGGTTSFHVGATGIYLLSIDGQTCKIAVKR